MPLSDTAARNSNYFTVFFFSVVCCGSLVFFLLFYFLIFSSAPFHNLKNSLVILSCAEERQFVWLYKHKQASLTYYTNKYWRIPAFYLSQITIKIFKNTPFMSPENQGWGIPVLLLSSCLSSFIQYSSTQQHYEISYQFSERLARHTA